MRVCRCGALYHRHRCNMSRPYKIAFLALSLSVITLAFSPIIISVTLFNTDDTKLPSILQAKDVQEYNAGTGRYDEEMQLQEQLQGLERKKKELSDSEKRKEALREKIKKAKEELQSIESVSKQKRTPVPVVILSYMRSGTTLMGAILGKHPDVFSIFEPLHALKRVMETNESLIFLDGRKRIPIDFKENAVQVMGNHFSCAFSELDIASLRDTFMPVYKMSREIYDCAMRRYPKDQRFQAIKECLSHSQQICEASRYITLKTIRLPMKALVEMLPYFPSLKIIHLIRDPRATLLAQHIAAKFRMPELGQNAEELCQRVDNDLKDAEYISAFGGNNIIRVRYEELAKEPIKAAHKIYDFIGATFSSAIKQFVWNVTQAGAPASGATGFVRPNSTEHIYTWRLKMKYENVRIIDQKCLDLYKRLGTVPLESESMLRNIFIPL